MDDGSPWDLVVAGHPVETVADLVEWLDAGALAPMAQVTAISAFLGMNRRRVPARLMLEISRFIVENEHRPIRGDA